MGTCSFWPAGSFSTLIKTYKGSTCYRKIQYVDKTLTDVMQKYNTQTKRCIRQGEEGFRRPIDKATRVPDVQSPSPDPDQYKWLFISTTNQPFSLSDSPTICSYSCLDPIDFSSLFCHHQRSTARFIYFGKQNAQIYDLSLERLVIIGNKQIEYLRSHAWWFDWILQLSSNIYNCKGKMPSFYIFNDMFLEDKKYDISFSQ